MADDPLITVQELNRRGCWRRFHGDRRPEPSGLGGIGHRDTRRLERRPAQSGPHGAEVFSGPQEMK
jgi:hypothetical protein